MPHKAEKLEKPLELYSKAMIRISLAKNDTKSECEFTIMLPRSYFSTTHREKVGEQFETEKHKNRNDAAAMVLLCLRNYPPPRKNRQIKSILVRKIR
jgi:hypothetical protein